MILPFKITSIGPQSFQNGYVAFEKILTSEYLNLNLGPLTFPNH